MEITIHRVTVTQGQYAHEQGTGYSLYGWGGDTDRLKGYSEPVLAELAQGYEIGESTLGMPSRLIIVSSAQLLKKLLQPLNDQSHPSVQGVTAL
jgi:hypothetical protein